jgi:hypothetical protein
LLVPAASTGLGDQLAPRWWVRLLDCARANVKGRVDRFGRWLVFNWWPWLGVPAGVALVLLLIDPAGPRGATPAWVLFSIAAPLMASVVLYRIRRGRT